MAYDCNVSIRGISKALTVNFNQTGDAATFPMPSAKYIITQILLYDWSATPNVLLAFTVRDTASGAGNSILGSIVGINTLGTATSGFVGKTPVSLGAYTQLSGSTMYLNISVANGTALTASVILLGIKLD